MTRRIVAIFLLLLLMCLVIVFARLFYISPGKPKPFLDAQGMLIPGSIAEKIETNINGVNQGIILRGINTQNPILLYVHGGPGIPEYALSEMYPTGLEDHVTICWWEQRGAGLSYDFEMNPRTITEEQLIQDTLEVTRYLRRRFGQDRIYLLGHSWGSYIAIQAAARFPEYYHGYIGVSQVSVTRQSELLGYQYLMNLYAASNNSRMMRKLQAFPVEESDDALYDYFLSPFRDKTLHSLKLGTMYAMRSRFWGTLVPIIQCRAYTLGEKIRLWRSAVFIQRSTRLFREYFEADLPSRISGLPIPLYFISGIYDQTVSGNLAEDMLKNLRAPRKGFYAFTQSANSPIFEEPRRFLQIITGEVLKGMVNSADGSYTP